MDIKVEMGQISTNTLSLPADVKARICKLYSSHPLMAFFPKPYDSTFTLAPGQTTILNVNIKSFSDQPDIPSKIQINCIDTSTKELLYAWILRVYTNAPKVNKIFEISSKIGVETVQKFVYQNRSTSWSVFEFQSSHPDILQV